MADKKVLITGGAAKKTKVFDFFGKGSPRPSHTARAKAASKRAAADRKDRKAQNKRNK